MGIFLIPHFKKVDNQSIDNDSKSKLNRSRSKGKINSNFKMNSENNPYIPSPLKSLKGFNSNLSEYNKLQLYNFSDDLPN